MSECNSCGQDTDNNRTWCTKCFKELEAKWSNQSKMNLERDPNIILLELTSA